MSTLQAVELGVLGPLQVRRDGAPVMIPGAKPRAILTMLGLHGGSVVSAETLIELLWGDDPPRTAAKALQTHISSLRRTLGDGFVLTAGTGWTLAESGVDASRYKSTARLGRDAAAAGDTSQAVSRFEEALALWRGIPELPDGRRGTSEKTRWIEGHAALVEDRADALLVTGRAAEIVGELEAAVADAPLRERRWGQLMLALYRAGRQGDALGAYQRARALLADELGVDPGPDLRRLEAAIVGQDTALEIPAAQDLPSITRTVTFLLTDIEGSTAAWEADADAMAVALARHDELVEQVVTSRGGRLIKTRGEGDATFSVFERASAAAAAAIELQDAIFHEPWGLQDPMRIRVALHTGEVELRDGDYFGRAVNRAARLRSLAIGGQILCSGAIAELVVDSLPEDVVLADLGMRQLRNLARPEHVFELRMETASDVPQTRTSDEPLERPGLPAVLTGAGPFVGRGRELESLVSGWHTALSGGTHAVLIAGEPGVGKTRLAGEWSRQAYQLEALVLYGRCDEDLGAPYQPFAEALRSLMPCLGTSRLRGMRGVESLLPLVPGLTEVLPDLAAPTRADPETERYALFDAVVALLEVASAGAPVVLILDDLHWAAKPTLLLLRHLLRFGDRARVQIVGTYRSTDLDRSHPLAAMLADLHRGAGSGTANRLALSGLDEDDVTAYVTEAGYNDEELARALASVTGGNPFFLIEALRHVDETGGVWDPTTLPQGVRETVSRRLSRLTAETNTALAAAAVVGSRFALDLVEKVVEEDLVDAFDEACKAGIVIEEPGGRYRFNHAIVRQSLLAELPSVRRLRLHQRIASTLENGPGADEELLAELAHHYFECAWAGNAAKAVEYCRRAADQAVARLAYEGAADLYGQALHALEEIDDELPHREDQAGELLVARCEALLAAGDVTSAAGAVSKLQETTVNSPRLAAWATCFDGQLSMLIHPERLDEVETALGLAAQKLAELDDAAGEANAHTVRAACLARLGRIGDGEIALDDALTAARRARDHRRVNAVLAGAPLAALWGPNPVPRAGGRCLDVVRLLRITTDSPAVEATSTRCQAVLEAFRGRAEAARRMIDSARRTVTELGLRHALLEVEQFAGIVELIVDDPTAAEPHFRQAYNGFRRMGLDADTAETAALLGGTCLALDRDAEADELCLESERLAGHALKASIAWRTLRARLLSRGHEHGEARRIAEAAVALAERTDALVDHGDSCLTLATVLGAAGDAAGARTAAERAVDLYERKGAAALAERARRILGERELPSGPMPPEPPPVVELDNACIRAGKRLAAAINRGAFDEYEQLHAPNVFSESRRKAVGFTQAAVAIVPPENWAHEVRRVLGASGVRLTAHDIAVRGERLALTRVVVGTADASPGAPQDEFLEIYGIDEEGRISLQIFFDLEDMDAAIAELDAVQARFEQEAHRQARRLENAASHASARHSAHFAARDWDELAKLVADDICVDDRRRVVSAGIRHGRDAEIANLRAAADVGIAYFASVVIAARGERLILTRASAGEAGSGEFLSEVLGVVEINSHNQIAAIVIFELDDFDSAIAELDARYLAGDAAAHASTWSVITGTFASVSRQELPALTPDCATIDHRRVTAFAPGEMTAYIRAGLEIDQTIRTYAEVVHRLNDLGAVCTYAAQGVSHEGFDGDWRGVSLGTVSGDMVNRSELFDEAELDTALAKFDQLSRPAARLENAASQAVGRYVTHFAARDWDALAQVLADDISTDDRRRVVNAGIRHGREAEIAASRAAADAGLAAEVTFVVIASRGERLVLARVSIREPGPETFLTDVLGVAEVNSRDQIAAIVMFDADDFDAAIAELDARYLAGEAAAHAHVLQPVMDAVGELNRHKPGPVLGRTAFADHRRVPFGSAENYGRAIEELWALVPDARYWTKAVHALDAHGLVSTLIIDGTDAHGNELQWGRTFLFLSDGPQVEVYDEEDLDVAIVRFEELHPPAPRLDNAANQVAERYMAHFAARDWDELAKVLADDICVDDRRRAVNAGIKHGRDAEIANLRAAADVGITYFASVVIAARGQRLILARVSGGEGGGSGEFLNEVLGVVEINSHNQIEAIVVFDLDDFDAAIAELDARYLAGEAAAYAHTWSLIARAHNGFNRGEIPATTQGWVNVDHRRVIAFAPGDMTPYIRATWDVAPDIKIHIEAVHRLSNLGAVFTHVGTGISREGSEAEWREITVVTVEDDLINCSELFDEADLDAALARFEQLSQPATRLENTASQVTARFLVYFAAREWDAMPQILGDDFSYDDRRRVVGSGVRDGGDAHVADMRASADLWTADVTPTVMATRGERLVLAQLRFPGRDQGPKAFVTDVLGIVEINADERMVAFVSFELDDFESALAELDARYLAGEAAAHARSWSVVARAYAAIRQREFGPMTKDFVNIDHRRGAAYAPGELIAYVRAGWDLGQDIRTYIEAVNRLDDFGAVVTHVGNGTSEEGFEAEWRGVQILTVDGEMVNRSEVFDEEDLDAAIVRFEELQPRTPRLENNATRAWEHLFSYIAAGDWDAVTQATAENVSVDDRRRVVNAGILHGRDANIKDSQATVDVGFAMTMVGSLATRGERLALIRVRVSGRDPGAIQNDALTVAGIDADDRIVAGVVFDLDDFDAAFAELDARYIAGEAAAHSHTWSVIAGAFAAVNRRELPNLASNWVNIDHRRAKSFAPGVSGDMAANISALWDQAPDLRVYIEAVHRLSDLGAVITQATNGTSQQGFEAEWRDINLETVGGDLVDRCELFDEEDLEAALAKFDQLSRPTPRLENAASQAYERFRRYFADRDWAAMAELLTADTSVDDHRRVVNAEIRRGRDVEIANMRAFADIGAKKTTATVIAIRGEHLVLCRTCISGEDEQPGGFLIEMLNIVETTAEKRILARVAYDPDDIDAAIEELDARYIAGEAAPYRDAWSVIAAGYAALNRYEVPPSAPDYVNIDHRLQATFEAADLGENLRAAWVLTPELKGHIEVVHRLSGLGAVVTHAAHGTTQDGLDAEWRGIHFLTLEGGMVNRCEIYDEADLDAAIARFDELSRPARRMENAASRVHERFLACFAAGDWDAIAEIMAEGFSHDDRRPVVGAGVQHGRDAYIVDMRAVAELWDTNLESTVVAIRGERLVLMLNRLSVRDEEPEAFSTEVLAIGEIDADERGVAVVTFDVDDIDAALAELDARYLAGEAAPHAHTWSVIARIYAGFNRREPPATTLDSVFTDHRPLQNLGAVDLVAAIRSMWDVASDLNVSIEAVHRLSELGAVVTQTLKGTSQEGLDAEWRTIEIFTVEGDLLSRCEAFDETDLDAALARFDELHPPTPRLENAASQVAKRFWGYFVARDWDAMAVLIADDVATEDRRRVVSAGSWHGRDFDIASMRATADIGASNATLTVVATRGNRLALSRVRLSGRDQRPEAFHTEALGIAEIDPDGRLVAHVAFDPEDFDAAFAELDARYLAGEAAAHARTWSVIARECAAFNRHELTAVDYITVDHRPLPIIEAFSQAALRVWDVTPDFGIHSEAVHRLSDFGAVATYQANGASPEGFDGEWRIILLLTVESDRIDRCEVFDESDLDTALARFEELHPQPPRLENAATQVVERFWSYFEARDWDAMAETWAEDYCTHDRRRVVNAGVLRGRADHLTNMRAVAEVGFERLTSTVIATRGQRLALIRIRSSVRGSTPGEVSADMPSIVETDPEGRLAAAVHFDSDDIDAAFEELDARYLAGEAAAHAHIWSVIARATAAFNRHELPAADWVIIDHRRLAPVDASDLPAAIRAIWDLTPDLSTRIEAVHRLSSFGAVVTNTAYGTSPEGFAAEWRVVDLVTVEGDRISRDEFFDEADVDAALARFEELHPQPPRLENAASQLIERFRTYFAARNWAAVAENSAHEIFTDDRRSVVSSGILHGRDIDVANIRAIADLGATDLTSTVIATRGERLVLTRLHLSGRDQRPEAFHSEMLGIVEIDVDNRVAARFLFDLNDIDAAFEELDARYLAGEAAAYARTWSVNSRLCAGFNRGELPATTPDWIYIDHRPLVTIEANDALASMRVGRDLTPDIRVYVEAVHRLSDLGAVVTAPVYGSSHEGFAAEWRMIDLFTVEGDLINRLEIFDEADLDSALARFDELDRRTPSFGNAATRTWARAAEAFNGRDVDSFLALMTADGQFEDRRKGLRAVHKGAARRKAARAVFEEAPASWRMHPAPIAIRGSRFELTRESYCDTDDADRPIAVELLHVMELDDADLMRDIVSFDPDDLDDAVAELTARWIASGEVAYPEVIEAVDRINATINRHDWDAVATHFAGAEYVNHRQLGHPADGTIADWLSTTGSLVPNFWVELAEILARSAIGIVGRMALKGTSTYGAAIEIAFVGLILLHGERVTRLEAFEEDQRDLALDRLQDFNRPV